MHAKSVLLFLGLTLFVLGTSLFLPSANASNPVAQSNPFGTGVMETGNPFANSGKVLSEEDVRKLTPKQILDHFGLGNAVPYFTDMLDHADQMFRYATRDQHFTMVNRVLEALKQSFMKTVDLVRKAPQPLPPVIDADMMDQVLDVMKQHFHDLLQKDPQVDLTQIEGFFRTYADAFFSSLKTGYRNLFGMGISLTWTIVYMVTPFAERLDTNVIDRAMFSEVLDAPEHLKTFLYDALSQIMTSDYAHFVQMAATFLSTIDLNKLMREKVEL
jgi:hypothetical protein